VRAQGELSFLLESLSIMSAQYQKQLALVRAQISEVMKWVSRGKRLPEVRQGGDQA
jgi:hypothetical protein